MAQPVRRRASAPDTSTRTNHNPQMPSSCCGDHCHGCGCGCRACACRSRPIQDDSNRQQYNGQGGQPMPTPQNAVTVRPGYPSSLSTIDSNDQSMSFNNSFEVHDTDLATILARHDPVNPPGEVHDDEDDDPWTSGQYLSHDDDVEPVDSSNMIGAEDMEHDSLYAETGGPSSSDMSILSSQYEVSFLQATDSVTASNLINGIGAAFANQFLPLTAPPAECRHIRTRQMCHLCRHY